jgi:hypothetical protein
MGQDRDCRADGASEDELCQLGQVHVTVAKPGRVTLRRNMQKSEDRECRAGGASAN